MMDIETRAGWRNTLLLLSLSLLAVILLLHPTFMSMVEIWERSETFAHGYVILPISLWLIWRNRKHLAAIPATTDWRALAVIILLGLGWLAARVGGVQVVEQYALVGILISTVWLLLGMQQLRALAFPLAFLLLMVPNGEGLIPPMMEFTADFTVAAVKMIGIPVFREGLFFTLPSGEWSVVEGCSGLRYLISSITLGVLYAYLTYRTLWKRVAFGLAAVIVPVIANGFRATMIVLIAHYSDMKLALGVDHFVYGWVWFGIVMLAMFWVGLIWREDMEEEAEAAPAVKPAFAYPALIALFVILAVLPLYEARLDNRAIATPALALPTPAQDWTRQETPFSSWEPHWIGMDQQLVGHYRKGDQQVMLYVAWYGAQRQNAELINSQNYMVRQKHPDWRDMRRVVKQERVAGQVIPLAESGLLAHGSNQRILVWQWHRIGGKDGISPYRAKFDLALNKLLGQADEATAIIVATPYTEDAKAAAATLDAFLASHKAALDSQLDQTAKP
jgi:exosortase A